VIAANMLVFARCLGFVFRAPGISNTVVPPMLRAGFALVLAVALSPAIPPGSGLRDGGSLLVAIVLELLIGAAIGYAASVLYDGAGAGGKMLDDYIGIQALNPSVTDASGEGFGRLWGMGFLAAFFLFDGYQLLIGVFSDGFARIPPGSEMHIQHLGEFAMSLPTLVMRSALLIAGPAIMLGFVVQLALGSISRVIPRFMNFTLIFPMVFGAVLVVTIVTFPFIVPTAVKPWLYLPFYEH
jgi:flagellar biosynthetic protein FliR